MTPAQIRTIVAASPEMTSLANARDWPALAASFNALALREPSAERIDTTRLMARMSNSDAGTVLATIRGAAAQNPLVEEALIQMRGAIGIDLSHSNARAMIDALFSEPLRGRLKALGEKPVVLTDLECESAVGLVAVTKWTGESSAPTVRNGMVYVTLTFTSSVQGVSQRVEEIWGDNLTPGSVAESIVRKVEGLQTADAAAALFG